MLKFASMRLLEFFYSTYLSPTLGHFSGLYLPDVINQVQQVGVARFSAALCLVAAIYVWPRSLVLFSFPAYGGSPSWDTFDSLYSEHGGVRTDLFLSVLVLALGCATSVGATSIINERRVRTVAVSFFVFYYDSTHSLCKRCDYANKAKPTQSVEASLAREDLPCQCTKVHHGSSVATNRVSRMADNDSAGSLADSATKASGSVAQDTANNVTLQSLGGTTQFIHEDTPTIVVVLFLFPMVLFSGTSIYELCITSMLVPEGVAASVTWVDRKYPTTLCTCALVVRPFSAIYMLLYTDRNCLWYLVRDQGGIFYMRQFGSSPGVSCTLMSGLI